MLKLVERETLLLHHFHNFDCLVSGNRREFIQKLIEAYPNAHVIKKGFNPDTGSAKNGCSILNFGVYANRIEVIHKPVL